MTDTKAPLTGDEDPAMVPSHRQREWLDAYVAQSEQAYDDRREQPSLAAPAEVIDCWSPKRTTDTRRTLELAAWAVAAAGLLYLARAVAGVVGAGLGGAW